jgi:tellurite resistance-related uncharacterized protein
VNRAIEGFRQDDEGDWIADLSCRHSQHVRHQPPFHPRPWVEDEAGREGRIGTDLDCPLCDRLELPDGLVVARTAGPFDADTLPSGLRRPHLVADRTWGQLRVIEGAVTFEIETDPPRSIDLARGDRQPIPPGVTHRVLLDDRAVIAVDFLVRPDPAGGDERRGHPNPVEPGSDLPPRTGEQEATSDQGRGRPAGSDD